MTMKTQLKKMKITKEMLKDRPLSYSSLKVFAKSPRHYINYLNRPATAQTDAMKMGSLIHCLMLTPDDFANQFFVSPEINRRTKDGKVEWEKIQEDNKDKIIVTYEDYAHASRVSSNALSNKNIEQLINNCYWFEMEWKAEISGLPFRGFYDGVSEDYIIEIKTTSDGNPKSVMNDFVRRQYPIQAGLYKMVSQKQIIYIVVETSEPYIAYAAPTDESYINYGIKEVNRLVDMFNDRLLLDDFDGGYDSNGEIVIKLPWSVDK